MTIETLPAEAAAPLKLDKFTVKAEEGFARLTLEITTRGGAGAFRDAARHAAVGLLEDFALRLGDAEEYRHFARVGEALAGAKQERIAALARRERLDSERRTRLLEPEALRQAEQDLRQAEGDLATVDRRLADLDRMATAARAALAGALADLWGAVYREHHGRLEAAGRQLADEVAALAPLFGRLRTLEAVRQAFAMENRTWPSRLARLHLDTDGRYVQAVLDQLGLGDARPAEPAPAAGVIHAG
jgi:hypothetical protein